MAKKTPYLERTFRWHIKLSLFIFSLLLIVAFSLNYVAVGIIIDRNVVKKNIIVEATLTDYNWISSTGSYPQYDFSYSYTDEKGVKYKGSTSFAVYGAANAEKIIEEGRTVKIYIDGKGHSVEVGAEHSYKKFITILIFAIIFTVGTIVFFIIFLLPKKADKNDIKK